LQQAADRSTDEGDIHQADSPEAIRAQVAAADLPATEIVPVVDTGAREARPDPAAA